MRKHWIEVHQLMRTDYVTMWVMRVMSAKNLIWYYRYDFPSQQNLKFWSRVWRRQLLKLFQHEAIWTWLERISFLYSGGKIETMGACVMTVSVINIGTTRVGHQDHSTKFSSFQQNQVRGLPGLRFIKLHSFSLFRKHGHSLMSVDPGSCFFRRPGHS